MWGMGSAERAKEARGKPGPQTNFITHDRPKPGNPLEQNRTERNGMERNRAEQTNRTEQSGTERHGTEQDRTGQNRQIKYKLSPHPTLLPPPF